MDYLLLTLGHGSSAIFVENLNDGQKVIGYEQERLSGIKADSQFPIDAINEIEHNIGFNTMKGCTILISHWFDDKGSEDLPLCKYFTDKDLEKLYSYQPTAIKLTSKEFTHHDAHAYSAYTFYDNNKKSDDRNKLVNCIVADGFGTNQEVLSIYDRRGNDEPKCIHRVYGYKASLGLFYQYATSFVGMKENQDEYKFLGYEAHIDKEFSYSEVEYLNKHVNIFVEYFIAQIADCTKPIENKTDSIIDFDALEEARWHWYNVFGTVLSQFDFSPTSFKARCAIAYFIQQTVEKVMLYILDKFEIINVCVAGGCFYNVKLNNSILNAIVGEFCAMPLAGDQGAAIGMYTYFENNLPFDFGTLCWGKRRMYNAKKMLSRIDDVLVLTEKEAESQEMIDLVAQQIADGKIVNIVRGNMEFGPRALCNTSTLMLPSTSNVAANNVMNNRNEVMPCAPVCTQCNAEKLFSTEELDRVIGSDKYMICTHNYRKPYSEQYGGVMHFKTLSEGIYTGRPQIVQQNDSFMFRLLAKVEHICDAKCLVNTSFNAHGNPIAFDIMDIIRNYKYQREHAEAGKEPILLVIL